MAEALELGLDIRKLLQQMKKLEDKFEKDFPQALGRSEKAMKEFEDTTQQSMSQASQSTGRLGKAFDKLDKNIEGMKRSMKSLEGSMGRVGRGFSMLTTAAIGFAGAYSIKQFVMFGATYERQIGVLKAVTRASTDEMLLLRKAIRETGASTEFTATQAAQAASNLAAMGMPAKEVAGNLKLMVASAQALQAPIEEVSRIIKAQQNVFGISTKEIADTLTGAYVTSAANLEKLDVALRTVSGSAKAAGLSFQETVGALAFMIDRGQSAERAGTALRGVMAQLSKPTKAAQIQMEKLGFSFDSIKDKKFEDQLKAVAKGLKQVGSDTERNRILMNLFDRETAGAAATLIQGFLEGKDVVSEMAKQVGGATTAMKAAKDMTDDVLSSVRNLGSALEDRVLEVWQTMEPVIKRVLDNITAAVKSLSDEDIYNAVESVGLTLMNAAEGFYNLIKGAVEGIAAVFSSPQFASLIQTGKTILTVIAGPDLSTQIAEAEGKVNELNAKIKIAEAERAATEAAGGFGKAYQDINDFLGPDIIGAWKKELNEAEEVLNNLLRKRSASDIMPSIADMGIDTKSLAQTWKDSVDSMRVMRKKQAAMNIDDLSSVAPKQVKVDYGTKTGLELTPEDRKPGGKKKPKNAVGSDGKDAQESFSVPDNLKALIPSMEAFNALSEDARRNIVDAMQKTLALSEQEAFFASQNAGAQALIEKSVAIQAETLAKPALFQAALAENTSRLGDIFTDNETALERFVALQGERVRLESQWQAAVNGGYSEQARALDGQLKGIESLVSGYQKQMTAEAKTAIETQKRVEWSDQLSNFIEEGARIGDQNIHYEQRLTQLKELQNRFADFEKSKQKELTDSKRAQLDSVAEALRLERERLKVIEKQSQVSVGEQIGDNLAGKFGILGDMAQNPQGFKDLAAGVADKGFDYSFDPASLAGGPQAAALDAILKLVTQLEIFQAVLDAGLGTFLKVIDALFKPFTNALQELTKAFEPIIDVIGELSTIIVEAFTPLKPFVALVKGVFGVLGRALKSLANGLRPLTHAMDQLAGIISSVFGGGGSFGQGIEDLEGALETVRSALEDLKFGDMNPASAVEQLDEATKKYDELRKKAFGADATNEDIEKFSSFAKTYLDLSKDVNKSSSKYVEDFKKVQGDLENLEGALVGATKGEGQDDFITRLIEGILKAAEQLAGAIVKAALQLLKGAISLLAKIAQIVLDKIKEALQGAWNLLTQLAQAVWDVITGALQGAWDLLSQLAQAVWDVIVKALTGYFNLMSKFYQLLWGIIVKAFKGTISLLQVVYHEVVKALEHGFDQAWDFLEALTREVVNALSRGFRQAWNFLKELTEEVAEALSEGFNQAWNFLVQLTREVTGALQKGFDQAFNFFVELTREVGRALQRGFTQAWNFFSMLVSEVGKALAKGFNQYWNFLTMFYTEVGKALAKGFSGAISFISKLVELVVNKLTEGFKGYNNFLQTLINLVVGKLREGFSGAISLIGHLFNVVSSAVTRAFGGSISMIGHLVNQVNAFITRGFTGTIDFVTIVKNKIFGLLSGGTNLLQQILDKIMKALGLSGQKGKIPILPNPIKFLGGPDNFLELSYSFAQGGSTQYMSGGKTKGPKHKSGMLGMTKAGTPFLFEGEEYIINAKTADFLGEEQLDLLNSMRGNKSQARSAFFQFIQNLGEHGDGVNLASYNAKQKEFARNKYAKLQTSGASGAWELLSINNPLASITDPDSWWIKAYFDLLGDPALDISSNMFFWGGSVKNIIKKVTAPIRNIQKQINKILFGGGGGGGGGGSAPATPKKPPRKEGTIGNPTVYPDYSLIPSSMKKSQKFDFLGDMVGNGFDVDLINVTNPFTYLVQEIVGWVRQNKLVDWFWKTFLDPIWGWVEKTLGPDRLKVGLDGSMLDFWNSYLDINFGGNVFEELGIERKPEAKNKPTGTFKKKFSNGGMVVGPSHSLGGYNAELEGGEYVIQKQAAQAFGYANLERINRGGSPASLGSDALLERIATHLENLSQPEIHVHVYTDMRGEAKAEIDRFKYEVRQKGERTRPFTGEKYVPLSALT